MADFTPDTPLIIGNEWVPIKETPYSLDSSQEIGTSFNVLTSQTVVSGAAYGVEMDGTPSIGMMMAVYPSDKVDETGPIQQVVIQANGASTSGTAGFGVFPIGSATTAGALASAYDRPVMTFNAQPGENGAVTVYFDTLSHTELANKRILKLEVLYYIGSVSDGFGTVQSIDDFVSNGITGNMKIIEDADSNEVLYLSDELGEIFRPDIAFDGHPIWSFDVGDANPLWDLVNDGLTVYPWNYSALQNFDAAAPAAARTGVQLFINVPASSATDISYNMGYMALRVTYCQEQRLLVGGQGQDVRWAVGRNMIPLRNPNTLAAGATLIPGDYTVTATRYTLLDALQVAVDGEMKANAITELYAMEAQKGVAIPSIFTIDASREAIDTPIMLELSLHTASASVPEVHPYGVQIQAPVWGTSTNPASQGVISSANGAVTSYPYARFYARHLPNTTLPLTLRDAASPTTTASITVNDFDALPEILDGWREVTLTFAAPLPSFNGASGLNTFEWVSDDTVGSQWQVMSAAAPAVTGSFPRVQLTSSQSLNAATYGGSTAFLTYNGVADPTADATLMFAQEMPAVSGLAVQLASLPITGIGMDCGVPQDCIPTGIAYNAITWTALGPTSMPASGFGYYELQRFDAIDDEWSTILNANSPLVTGFSDFEARAGMESSYRIRFMHRLLFPSAWSAEVDSTLPAPGVTGTDVATGVLIFTTNERQDGSSSLAYAMQWEGEVTEGFTFIEAASLQMQKMYGRDFQVAFRPLERGGEAFSRALLVSAAAVPSGLIQQGFTSLRDLAWEDVSYICVRDELGDRWLANVNVPDGNVRRNRRLYMASVDITEVTDTPSIVTLPSDTDGDGIPDGPGSCVPALWDSLPGWDYGCWGE